MNTEAEFKVELKSLLKKYNVVMSIEEDVYEDPHINFFRYPQYENGVEGINWDTQYEDGDIYERFD